MKNCWVGLEPTTLGFTQDHWGFHIIQENKTTFQEILFQEKPIFEAIFLIFSQFLCCNSIQAVQNTCSFWAKYTQIHFQTNRTISNFECQAITLFQTGSVKYSHFLFKKVSSCDTLFEKSIKLWHFFKRKCHSLTLYWQKCQKELFFCDTWKYLCQTFMVFRWLEPCTIHYV